MPGRLRVCCPPHHIEYIKRGRGDNLAQFLQLTFSGIAIGCVYALVALGISLIFGVMRILNVAHGSFYAFGGYAAAKVSAVLQG